MSHRDDQKRNPSSPFAGLGLGQWGDIGEGIARGTILKGEGIWSNPYNGALLFTAPDVAFRLASARRGTKATAAAGGLAGNTVAPAAFWMGNTLGRVATASRLGAFQGTMMGTGLGLLAYSMAEKPVQWAVGKLEDEGRYARRFHFGGDYQDSQKAFTMRQRAEAEMSSSLLNARHQLGNEARLMHY